ncbi:MAG: NADH-quinone oxidoreductase subunit C [Deltaproteobacteria bacterium]|nr:MAG: NADH-quinone oxidoreductase subunit C [Deltaproteobacteria bacterium]
MEAQRIYQLLTEKFPGNIYELKEKATQPASIRVNPETIVEISSYLRDDSELAFDFLMCLSAVDYPENFTVVYHLFSTKHLHKIAIGVKLPREAPRVHTVEVVWPAANWHEREAYDLMGIVFDKHSDLRRILLPDDWDGHTLRKDYQAPKTYNGVKI